MTDEMKINQYSITGIAGTVSRILGIEPPKGAKTVIEPLLQLAAGRTAEKMLIYDPDAVAMWLWRTHPDYFLPVMKHTQLALPMHCVMPSVTPVCFASIYTGLDPVDHGIQEYRKPVLECDTLFDALVRAGKKTALVAVGECSMAKIFLNRDIDYYIIGRDGDAPGGSHEVALQVIDSDKYDCIIVYNGSYDSTMHRNGVLSEAALSILDDNAKKFDECVTLAKSKWAGKTALYGWVTDHGCHDNESGRGTHGTDLPDDLNITHFWGFSDR